MRRAAALFVAAALAACTSRAPDEHVESRAFARLAASDAVAEMESADPALSSRVAAAAGWAAFGSTGDSLFARGPGDGLGLAHDNRTGRETPMRITVPDADRRLGLRSFRALLVFSDADAFARFVLGGDLPPAGVGVDVRWSDDGAAAPPPPGVRCSPE